MPPPSKGTREPFAETPCAPRWPLTVKLRGRTEAPAPGAEGAQFLSARGTKPEALHGPLQRWLDSGHSISDQTDSADCAHDGNHCAHKCRSNPRDGFPSSCGHTRYRRGDNTVW